MISHRVAITCLFLTSLCLILAGCGNGGAPTPTEQTTINQADRLHRTLTPAVMNQDVNLRRYVQQVGQRLMNAAGEMHRAKIGPPSHFRDGGDWMFGKDMRFQLLRCPVPNAFTPGGTHVYVYNGLLQRCQSEEEFAAGMAHAYAHLYARHGQQRATLPEDASAEDVVVSLINNRYTPQQELEAENLAFQLFARAGWDPAAYGLLAQRLQESGRADAARARAESLPPAALDWAKPPIADARRFAEYQKTAQTLASEDLDEDIELLLTAVPGCLTSVDQPAQRTAQQELLNPTAPVEIPNPFEKGPRARPR